MTQGHDRPLAADKSSPPGNAFKAAYAVFAALFTLLMVYAASIAKEYWYWPEVFRLSSWLVIPAVMALWGIVLSRSVMLFPRSAERPAEIAPRSVFLKELRRERLRADRSKVPLSMAIFNLEGGNSGESFESQAQQLIGFLRTIIRETDILGNFGDGRIGLLLTDTDENGREAFIRKLLVRRGDFPVSIIAMTYPDQAFDCVATENCSMPEPDMFFIDVSGNPGHPGYASKRPLDVMGALAGIIVFSPLMLLAAAAIKLTSPGPVIFRQIRLGKNGLPFVFYKFRSMAWNADDRIHREYVENLISGNTQAINQGDTDAPLYKLTADPRVTWVGRFIRKTSIDELPQFFNVLKGEMSLVGPRPPLPYEVQKYQSWHFRRIFEMKPGITGLWQVEGRSRTSFDDMVRLDLDYIRRCSLALDLQILCKTVKVVAQGAGAA